jgi:hypothetical protein
MARRLLVAIVSALPLAGWAGAPPSEHGGQAAGKTLRVGPTQLGRAAAPIRSAAQLAGYLAVDHGPRDPLVALSPPARARFLESLRFGPNGLVSFQSGDIQAELSATQAYSLLSLFGLQAATCAIFPFEPTAKP